MTTTHDPPPTVIAELRALVAGREPADILAELDAALDKARAGRALDATERARLSDLLRRYHRELAELRDPDS